MKPYNETTKDPFLCDDCQQLGYCRKNRESAIDELLPQYFELLSEPNNNYHYMKDIDIINLVPVKTIVKDYYTTAGRKLQQAHDLFHQSEYEQASYLYRDLQMQRADYHEAAIGLAASYFFMNLYEEATTVAAGINHYAFDKILPDFLDACVRAAKEVEKIESQRIETKLQKCTEMNNCDQIL